MTPPIAIGEIENVHESTNEYIRRRWGLKFYLPGGALLVFSLTAALYWQNLGPLIIPIVWFAGGWGLAQEKIRKEFMRQFAARNNFSYRDSGSLNEVEGALFQRGHSREIRNVVLGDDGGHPVRFYFFTYVISHGKEKKVYRYTVGEIAFPGVLPDIIVEARGDSDHSELASSHFREINLGGTFHDYFGVFVQDDLEIEAFQVFTPDIMEELMEKACGYNFEFINRKLYVFKIGWVSTRTELGELLGVIRYLVARLAPRLISLHDDVEAIKAAKQQSA